MTIEELKEAIRAKKRERDEADSERAHLESFIRTADYEIAMLEEQLDAAEAAADEAKMDRTPLGGGD